MWPFDAYVGEGDGAGILGNRLAPRAFYWMTRWPIGVNDMRRIQPRTVLQTIGLAAMAMLMTGCDETEQILDTIYSAFQIVTIWV